MFDTMEEEWSPVQRVKAPIEPDHLDELALVPIATLEARVTTLAGHLASATCRWLLLLGEFDARNGWSGAGIRSCAQWLSWRCGLSLPAARQHVRVARAMRGLPRVRSEFAAGRLSYSKVRSIVRVDDPGLEDQLVELALTVPAGQLDSIVAAYRRTRAIISPRSGRPARSTTWHWDEDGSLVVRSRLTQEEGVLFLTAIEAMQRQLTGDDPAGNDPAGSPGGDGHGDLCDHDETAESYRCSRTDAVVAMAATALAAGPVDTTGSDRHEVVIHADLDQLLDHHDDHGEQAEGDGHGLVAPALKRGRCHLRGGPCIHPATLHRLACDAALRVMIHDKDGTPIDTGRRTRLAKGNLRRRLEDRDHRRCQFPGCHHTKFLHAHHIVHWADGGLTTLDNLILLCGYHHRLLHEHGYNIQTPAPGQFTFHRPDGNLINPAPELAGQPRLHALQADLHAAPPVTEHTPTPNWHGERLDLGYIISLLFPREETEEGSWPTASLTA